MNVYVLGAFGSGNLADDCYMSVLQEKFVTVWPNHEVHFHSPRDTHFCPNETEELLLTAGCRIDEYSLRYAAATQWFGKRSVMFGASTQADLRIESMDRLVPIIDAMALRTVRDHKSAQMLRASGVRSPICTCADLAYLLPWITPDPARRPGSKPVAGVFGSVAECEVESGFDIRRIGYDPEQADAIERMRNDLRQVDLCVTNDLHGVIFCVLENIPFVVISQGGDPVDRECAALGYPTSLSLQDAWAERSHLKDLLKAARPRRIRLAERNMELLRAMPPWESTQRNTSSDPYAETLVIWAAGDEFWDEARPRLDPLQEFDCLMPANSTLRPTNARKRFSLPAGTLMHWAMMPGEITNEIEQRYQNVVLCHTQNKEAAAPHLLELASRSGRRVWEYGLWIDSFKVAAPFTGAAAG